VTVGERVCCSVLQCASHAHCNTATHALQHTSTNSDTLRESTRKSALQCVAVCKTLHTATQTLQHTATHCNTLRESTCKSVLQCVAVCNTLHIATHCTLQHTARCYTHTATHCDTLRESTRKSVPPRARSRGDGCGKCVRGGGGLEAAATHCNTLQHTAQHCNILHHTATPCNTLQHTTTRISLVFVLCSVCVGGRTLMPEQHTATQTATKCDILQYTATHCNTLQHLDAVTKFGSLNVLKVIVICKTRTRNTSTASRCYRVFQCGAVCCSVLQCVAMCWYSQCQI